MQFVGTIDGYEVTAQIFGNSAPKFWCLDISQQSFDDLEKLDRAIKAYNLSLRKKFANPQAWHFSCGKVIEVEVTSLTENGKEAWIKSNGKREKVNIQYLFADRNELIAAFTAETEFKTKISEAWALPRRWAPLMPEEGE